jgi:hypothetical protein
VLALAYSLSSLSAVRAYRAAGSPHSHPIAIDLALQMVIIAAVYGWAGLGWIPRPAMLVFVPIAVRHVLNALSPPANLRALGVREIGIAASYVVLACAGLVSRSG